MGEYIIFFSFHVCPYSAEMATDQFSRRSPFWGAHSGMSPLAPGFPAITLSPGRLRVGYRFADLRVNHSVGVISPFLPISMRANFEVVA